MGLDSIDKAPYYPRISQPSVLKEGPIVPTQPPRSVDLPAEADRHRVDLGVVQLEVEEHGSGEPVLLIHAALLADWFSPLLAQSNLRERYRLVSYHRVGFAGSSRATPPLSIADQASHARLLLEHLGRSEERRVGKECRS